LCPPDDPADEAPPQPQAVERYWTTLTEEELLNTEFTTDNPNALSGVVHELPQTDEVPYVEFAYSVGARQVRCVYDRYDNHGKGIVMKYRDGTRILVGWVCARKIWDVNFDLVAKDFDLAQKEAHYLRRRNAARAGAPMISFEAASSL